MMAKKSSGNLWFALRLSSRPILQMIPPEKVKAVIMLAFDYLEMGQVIDDPETINDILTSVGYGNDPEMCLGFMAVKEGIDESIVRLQKLSEAGKKGASVRYGSQESVEKLLEFDGED